MYDVVKQIILLPLFLIVLLWWRLVIIEKSEYQRKLNIVSEKVIIKEISKKDFDAIDDNKNICEFTQWKKALELNKSYDNTITQMPICSRFEINGITVIWTCGQKSCTEQYIVFVDKGGIFNKILSEKANYPGSYLLYVKSLDTQVVFSYSGWNNPIKYYSFTIK